MYGGFKLRGIRQGEYVPPMGDVRNLHFGGRGKREGKIPLERPGFVLEDNIKMDLRGKGCKGMNRLRVGSDDWYLCVVMKYQVPKKCVFSWPFG